MLGQIFCVPNSNNSKKGWVREASTRVEEINKQVHKNKYQMPNIEELMDTVGQTISEKNRETYISQQWT